MPKRKRAGEGFAVETLYQRFSEQLCKALSNAKGFERQRQSKRLHDRKTTQNKKDRIGKEIVVLKSLDLRQVAHAHLSSALLRIKPFAESAQLPEHIKARILKPNISEEERNLLHNVTSSLCNRSEVRQLTDEAVSAVCRSLGVLVTERQRKGTDAAIKGLNTGGDKAIRSVAKKLVTLNRRIPDDEKPSNTQGGHDVNGRGVSRMESGTQNRASSMEADVSDSIEITSGVDGVTGLKSGEEERAFSPFTELPGSSSGGGSDAEDMKTDRTKKSQWRDTASNMDKFDPMEITSDEEAGEGSPSENPVDKSGDISGESKGGYKNSRKARMGGKPTGVSESSFRVFDPKIPGRPSKASNSQITVSLGDRDISDSESETPRLIKTKKTRRLADSTFLPSLMEGFISGSESASDVDLGSSRKNRRGQRARQKIWEKKYKDKAKHLSKPVECRDAGWDPKRGALDGDGKPWKRGIRNPLAAGTKASEAGDMPFREKAKPKRTRDDTGPLHPSWEAKKKAKEKEQLTAPFQGKRITFD